MNRIYWLKTLEAGKSNIKVLASEEGLLTVSSCGRKLEVEREKKRGRGKGKERGRENKRGPSSPFYNVTNPTHEGGELMT